MAFREIAPPWWLESSPCSTGGAASRSRRPMSEKQPADTPTGASPAADWTDPTATALLILADGTVLEGTGLGATGHAVGEVCFNTAMTGYQEILTDPSYAGQIITTSRP
jgi:carbamoyl-phosphate synthase small subunit